MLWLGSFLAAASGAAYALFGVMMRQSLTGGLSAPLTMFISGAVGTISLWSMTLFRLGPETLSLVPSNDWATMFAAGCLNFTAFVALSASLKSLPVVAVNLINASQVAMAAAAGIVLFAEPVTSSLVLGIALTFAGLGILAGRRPQRGLSPR
jgi:drug/metabolite transporter (DMT)-like permease